MSKLIEEQLEALENNCFFCNAPRCGCDAEEVVVHYGCEHRPDIHPEIKAQALEHITKLIQVKLKSSIEQARQEERERIVELLEQEKAQIDYREKKKWPNYITLWKSYNDALNKVIKNINSTTQK